MGWGSHVEADTENCSGDIRDLILTLIRVVNLLALYDLPILCTRMFREETQDSRFFDDGKSAHVTAWLAVWLISQRSLLPWERNIGTTKGKISFLRLDGVRFSGNLRAFELGILWWEFCTVWKGDEASKSGSVSYIMFPRSIFISLQEAITLHSESDRQADAVSIELPRVIMPQLYIRYTGKPSKEGLKDRSYG